MDNGGLVVRHVAQEDFELWLDLWNRYNAFYGRSGATALPLEITRTSWSRFLEPREDMFALVAQHGGELVGLAHYLYHRSTISQAPVCYLQDLFTSECVRRKGIGRTLIERVCIEARSFGAHRVYWQTHETNMAARRLYDEIADRSGFIVYRKSC